MTFICVKENNRIKFQISLMFEILNYLNRGTSSSKRPVYAWLSSNTYSDGQSVWVIQFLLREAWGRRRVNGYEKQQTSEMASWTSTISHREPSHRFRVLWPPFWIFNTRAQSASARSGTEILQVWDSQILGGSDRSPKIIKWQGMKLKW